MFDILLKTIKNIYGFHSKNIPLILERDDNSIANFKVIHDGKSVVEHSSFAHPECLKRKMLSNFIGNFESIYGDSSSFLTILTLELLKIGKKIEQKDLDSINNMIDKSTSKGKLKEYIKTVLKNDESSDKIAEIFMNSKIHQVIESRTGVKEKFSVENSKGFCVKTKIEPVYSNPQFQYSENVDITIDKRKICPKIFSDYLSVAHQSGSRIFVACDYYSVEVEDLINRYNDSPVVLFKAPFGKTYILDDLIVALSAELEKETGTYFSKANIRIGKDKLLISPVVEGSHEKLQEYANTLARACGKNSEDILKLKNRCRNILEGQISTLYIETDTRGRMDDLKEMLNDLLISLPHVKDSYLKGYMQWFDNSVNTKYLGIALENLKECFEGEKPACFYKDAQDSANIIKEAIRLAVEFNNDCLKIDFDSAIVANALNA